MNIELALIDQQVQGIVKEYNEKLDKNENKQISKAFLYLTIKTLFELDDEEEIFDCMYDSGNDYSIDGLFVSDVINDSFTIKIIQTKYKRYIKENGEYYNGDSKFPRNDIQKMLNSINLILDPQKEVLNISPKLSSKIAEIKDLLQNGIIPNVEIYMCNNGLKWDEESESIIKQANLPEWIVFKHINHKNIINFLREKETIDDKLDFKGKIIVEDFNYARVLIGKVNVKEFYKLFDKHGDKLLEKNVRKFLGVKNRVNEAIKQSLLREDNSNFFFLNNGITMVVSDFSYNAMQEKDFMINLKDINIINGGQTCKTIQETIKENPNINFENAYVLVRVYKLSPEQEKMINEITYATNSQTAINLRDLKANDEIQKNLIESVRNLEIKNNVPVYIYKPKRDSVVSRNAITIAVAAEAILSIWLRKPHIVKFRKNRMFEDVFYNEIFSNTLNGAQLVLAVLIWRFVETKRKTAINEIYEKYPFLGYSSNIVSMIIGQFLLNDFNFDTYLKINHNNFRQIKEKFEEEKENYYIEAMNLVKKTLESDSLNIDFKLNSLQKIAGTFRGGYLTQEIIKILNDM